MEQKKLVEGSTRLANAEKAMKSSWFKRADKPTAITEYEAAGLCFRLARSWKQAQDCFSNAADLNVEFGDLHHAGNNYDKAAQAAHQNKSIDEAAQLFSKAGNLYREYGSVASAAGLYERAGKTLEDHDFAKAIDMYFIASDVWELEDRHSSAYDALRKAVSISLKQKNLEKAMEILERQIQLMREGDMVDYMFNAVAALVLVQLAYGDIVAAEQICNKYASDGMAGTQPGLLATRMVTSYNDRDQEAFQRCRKLESMGMMDNELQRLFNKITVPGGGKKKEEKVSAPPTVNYDSPKASPQPVKQSPLKTEDKDVTQVTDKMADASITPLAQEEDKYDESEEEEDDDEDGVC